ncbi:protein kinase domain-containing protein [Streptomyces apocyni]|uniref:protein kinase domain-containing protein n=1 Tax=Streptomyces apocyni TaxID=2654677 RepID=UPI0012EA3A82|nr:protein kinase [Streptomyces apocyni]
MSSVLTADDPERIAGYWLAARLGAGGQGVVYEAYDASGDRYALKTLHRGTDPADTFLRERFAREAEAARRVAAFCTARILDSGVDGDVAYLVSEYVPGPTLSSRLRAQGPLEPGAVLRLATGVATALAAVHQADVVHRDLKPSNVLLGPDGPRIIDFGIARASGMSLTETGAIMGTFGYMAPEVLSGQRATEASDIFAWAAVVLYAATGTEPFRGENIGEVAHRTASVDPDLSALPARVRPLMAAALAKDPRHRPTAGDLLLGLLGAPVQAADPRTALMKAGARKAAEPDPDPDPESGSGPDADPDGATPGHPPTVVEPPLGERAETAFAALTPAAQLAAHELLLRLTVPGSAADGSQDSVRTASPAEVFAGRPDSETAALTEAATSLTAAGVLITDADGSLRPVSAALVPAWRRLRAWVDADRTGITRLQRISAAARLWEAHGERAEDLPRGTELRTGLEWLPTAPYHLRPSPLELRFLTAGRTAAARSTRRRRQLLAGLAGVTVLALLAGGVAWTQNQAAELRRSQATARAVAQAATALPGTEPETAMLLGLAAWRIAEVPEARAALTAAAVQPERAVLDLPPYSGDQNGGEQDDGILTPDGRRLITHSARGVHTWDLTKGRGGLKKPLAALSPDDFDLGDSRRVFSPDGQLVLLKGKDQTFRLINTKDGTPAAPPIDAPGHTWGSSISNRGHLVLTKTETKNRVSTVFDRSGRELDSLPSQSFMRQYALSSDGTYLAQCVGDRLVVGAVRPAKEPARPVVDDTGVSDRLSECQFQFSPDGTHLAVDARPMSKDSTVTHVYDLARGKKVAYLEHGGSALRFSSGGRFLVGWSAGRDVVEVWDRAGARKPLFEVAVPTDKGQQDRTGAARVSLDEDGEVLRYVADGTGQFYEIDLAGALTRRATDPATAAISPNGDFGVVRDEITETRKYPRLQPVDLRADTDKPVGPSVTQRTIDGADMGTDRYSAIDNAGRILAYSHSEGVTRGPEQQVRKVVVRDLKSGKDVHEVPVRGGYHVRHLGVSPDGRQLSITTAESLPTDGPDCYVEIWDLRQREKVRQLDGNCGSGVFSQDSRRLLTTTGVEVDLDTGTVRKDLFGPGPNADLAFSPDGRFVAVLKASGWVELWDGAVRERAALMPSGLVPGAARFGERLGAMTFSDDGSLLAVVVNDDSVQLWDTAARLPLGEPVAFTGHRLDALSFDGRTLRTVTSGRVHTLDLSTERLAAAVCRRAGRDITPREWRTYIPDAPYRSLC